MTNRETLVGYKREDVQRVVEYLEGRPYKEVYDLIPILYNCQNVMILDDSFGEKKEQVVNEVEAEEVNQE